MKPLLKLVLIIAGVLCIAAGGSIYYEVLPGLKINHPITGATTIYLDGTNGTVTAGYFVGDGSGLTGLPSGGGNMTNAGASVVGMVAVATDTTGTQWTPTNNLTLQTINVTTNNGGTLVVSNMVASTVPIFDANIVMQPSRTPTNALDSIRNYGTNWAVGDLGTGVYLGERKYCTNVITPWGTGDWVEWDGSLWKTLRSRITATDDIRTFMINSAVARWNGRTDLMVTMYGEGSGMISVGNNFGDFQTGSAGSGSVSAYTEDGVDGIQPTSLSSATGAGFTLGAKYTPSGSDWVVHFARVKLSSIANTGTEQYYAQVGYSGNQSSLGTVYGGFFFDPNNTTGHGFSDGRTNNWIIEDNGLSAVDTTVAADASSWMKLGRVSNYTTNYYYLNGTCILTNTGTTTSAHYLGKCFILKGLGTSARSLNVDYEYVGIRYGSGTARVVYP